ncbi:hypothetical protein [Psychrobacillus sp. FSL K6-1267]|uniref:hypothetical protein n=1 Tax=Psychrobacillus sp. FSL K6-1267 TaxID=2921543 RepID=UPI0030F72263
MVSHKKNRYLFLVIAASLSLSACSDSIFKERVSENETKNLKIEKDESEKSNDDSPPAEIHISDEQKEVITDSETITSAEDAVKNSELSLRQELEIIEVPEKDAYTDVNEFSQYVNGLFFLYHSKQIDAETFYNKINPHFSKEFTEYLPKDKEEQIQVFNVLQKTFIKQLKSPIKEYQITNVEIGKRIEEASVYRKYIQANGELIYYESVFIKQDGKWLILDDSPAPPYVISSDIESKFEKKKGD